MFHPSVIERFARCAPGLSGMALRTNQRFIARRAVPQFYPADVPLPRERSKRPYAPAEIGGFLALADAQPTRERRMRASGPVCPGAGAGLIRAGLRDVRGSDVIARSGGLVAAVRGRRAALVMAALAIPSSRRFCKRRAWCLISRHRLQRVCYEGRLHTRAGRLPLILWIRPTKVGERAHVLCRAGICADDFDACKAEIGAGCYAREARVIRNKKWSHLVTIDIIRHDPLTADVIIPSRIIPRTRPG